MLAKFQKHIAHHFPFLKDKKLLIAISGGVDSVVLTHLLHQLHFDISLAHCNFKLRGNESDTDEQFVKDLGEKISIQTFTTQFDTEKYATDNQFSTQVAARNLRYHWFDELIKNHSFDFVLTAHHADDNLETFLINFTRGTGLEGLTGIPTINNSVVRPMLMFSREEILHFATHQQLVWREDESNASTKYLRNKIRHEIVPILKEINPQFLESFQKTTENLKGSQFIIDKTITELKKKTFKRLENKSIQIEIAPLLQLKNAKAYLFELLQEYGFTEWNNIVDLLTAQSGKEVFSSTHRLLKDRDYLLLLAIQKSIKNESFFIEKLTTEITSPIHLVFKEVVKIEEENIRTIYLDLNKVLFPLILRKWKNGDVFYPKGMKGKKKLSKYFKDEKYSLLEKENTWLLCSNKHEILWIVGKRQDKRFSKTENSSKLLKIMLI